MLDGGLLADSLAVNRLGNRITVGRRDAQVKATISSGRESTTAMRDPSINLSRFAEWFAERLSIAFGRGLTDLIGNVCAFSVGNSAEADEEATLLSCRSYINTYLRSESQEASQSVTPWTTLSPGEYVLTQPITVPSGTTVDLTNIILRYPPNAEFQSLLDIADSSNIEVFGGIFDGNVQGQPSWQEHQHAIRVRGSSHLTIHDCTFVNLSGDGVLVYQASTDVAIQHCTFRGQNTNRNGVSITNALHCRITDCTFEGMTRPNMPGPIDLEPDVPQERVADILIARNEFVGTGQPVQAAINVFNAIAHAPITNITIEQNRIRNSFQRAIWIVGGGAGLEQNIVIRDNHINDLPTREPIQIKDAQVSVSDNVIEPQPGSFEPQDRMTKRARRRERAVRRHA